jgi:methylase of polypeptide subunit release factors
MNAHAPIWDGENRSSPALADGEDGLDFTRVLLAQADRHLKPEGC